MPEASTVRPKLKQGSRIALVSPASAAKPELVAQGSAALRAYCYDPIVMPHALDRGPLYYAGTASNRVADLHAAFADPAIDAILCTRGGWGSAELLPLLDAQLIRANPKVFIGYSDHTSLHLYLWNLCKLPTFYAPMAAADWSNPEGIDHRTWQSALHADTPWSVSSADGLRTLKPGHAATVSGPATTIDADAPQGAERSPTTCPAATTGTAVIAASAAFTSASPASTAAVSGPLGPD